MFGTHLFNTSTFNGSYSSISTLSTDRVVFEGFSICDGVTMLMTEFLDSGPSREIIGGVIPRGDGMFVTADYFRERVFEARGIVRVDSAAELDTMLDTIKKNLRAREGNLDI